MLRFQFGRIRWNSQLKRLKWKLGSVCLEIVLILMQDRCTVCMGHTICLKSIWMHLMELLDEFVVWNVALSVWRQYQFRCKIGAEFMPNAPQPKKPFWAHLLVLLDEEAQVEAWFDLFGDSTNLDAIQVHNLHGTYHMLINQFGRTRWNSEMTCVIWNLGLIHLETVLDLVQDRCTVCTYYTIA